MKLAIMLSLMMVNTAFSAVLDFDFPQEMQSTELAEHILDESPEVVQISKISTKQATQLYTSLQDDYEHFLYIPKSSLFIISKKNLELIPMRSRNDNDKGGAGMEGGATASWGDGKGIHWEAYVKGEVHDGKGNYAEVEVSQSDDGKGEVRTRGGHDSDQK